MINGDRMPQVIERALEKHMLDPSESPNYCLVQLLPDGSELDGYGFLLELDRMVSLILSSIGS